MKTRSPFNYNPFTLLQEPKLVAVPNAPETHPQRTPLRSYLSRSSDGLGSLLDALGGSGKKPKKVVVEKFIPRETSPEEEVLVPRKTRSRL